MLFVLMVARKWCIQHVVCALYVPGRDRIQAGITRRSTARELQEVGNMHFARRFGTNGVYLHWYHSCVCCVVPYPLCVCSSPVFRVSAALGPLSAVHSAVRRPLPKSTCIAKEHTAGRVSNTCVECTSMCVACGRWVCAAATHPLGV